MLFNNKILRWIKIAESREEIVFDTNRLCSIEVSGKNICIAFFNDGIYATAQKCPHASGLMHAGYIDAVGNIVCPLHRYRFSLATGRNSSGEGYFLKTYKVEEREDGVWIGVEW
jgi:nitrite reductase/ring-hydroxylating ferredoxin subunit